LFLVSILDRQSTQAKGLEEDRSMDRYRSKRTVVIKLGGSVLVGDESYRQAARFLARRLQTRNEERLVVVVSARRGITDELQRLARNTTPYPSSRTLDLLWSTGEIHSVAFLTLHLEEIGASAVGLNVHETGLRLNGSDKVGFLRHEIEEVFDGHSIVVVPGFFGTHHGGAIRSLGRGGSDLSAVLLANGLDATRCELIKDVTGYFDGDPHSHTDAVHLPQLSYERALQMADSGCDLIQPQALEAARQARVRLVVRSMDDDAPSSMVFDGAVEA
jgi:aspartate kinase